MGVFAEELRVGIDEAARKMTEARLAGQDHGAEAWRERLGFLRRVAKRHGLGPWPKPERAAGPSGGRNEDAAALTRSCGPRAEAAG